MFNPITSIKDTLTSKVISCALQKRMAGFGSVVSFTLNSRDRIIMASLMLDGEDLPVNITINGYDFKCIDEKRFFVIRNLAASKEWVTAFAKKYPDKMRLELPEHYWWIIAKLFNAE